MLAMKCNTFGGNPDADRDARAVHAAVGGQRPVRPVGLRVAEAAVKNAPGAGAVPYRTRRTAQARAVKPARAAAKSSSAPGSGTVER